MRCVGKPEGFHLNEVELVASDCYNVAFVVEVLSATDTAYLVILNRIASDYDTWQIPVILTGDFNVTPDSVVVKSVLSFNGCGEKLVDATADIPVSFHGYHPDTCKSKIDYVFTNLPFIKGSSFAATDCENSVYLSDHYPVGTVLEL